MADFATSHRSDDRAMCIQCSPYEHLSKRTIHPPILPFLSRSQLSIVRRGKGELRGLSGEEDMRDPREVEGKRRGNER